MIELKKYVERCVRPVKAEDSKKLEMRKELYDHLYAAYEQERTNTDNDEQAALAAIARMGDPNELTTELSASLSLLDRWTGTVEGLTYRDIKERPWQYATRLARLSLKLTLMFLAPFVLITTLIAGQWGQQQQILLRVCFAILLLETLGSLGWGYFHSIIRDNLEHHGWHRRHIPLFSLIALALMLIIPTAGWVFFYIVSGDATESTAFLPRWILLSLLAVLAILWTAWLDAKLTRELREWKELELDQ